MERPLFADVTGEPPPSPPCPFCDGTDTRMLSPFGGQLSVAQCWCNRCRTGFEFLKWEGEDGRETTPER
jgi:hypothetical protein